MKSILNYFFCLGLILFLGACSKEKRVEKWLKKGTGEWQIKSYNSKFYENDTLQSDETHSLYGKYVFDEQGSYLIVTYFDAEQTIVYTASGGSWTNSKDVIYMTPTGSYKREVKILEISKTKMVLEETESADSEIRITTIWLEKEKK